MQDTKELYTRLDSDPDFVCSRRHDYSLKKLMERYPEGVPAKVAARALLMTDEEFAETEAAILAKFRRQLRVGR